MNRLQITVCFFLLLGPGCALFRPDVVRLTPEQVAQITQEAGALNAQNLDAWIAGASRQLGDGAMAVKRVGDEIHATLKPVAEEYATRVGASVMDQLVKNPTPAAIPGVLFTLLGALNIFGRRKSLVDIQGVEKNGH